MWIRKKQIDEYYQTPCKKTAVVSQLPNDRSILTVRDNGVDVFKQEYSSRKGAVIAMGRRFGKCKFHHMTSVFETSEERFKEE